MTIRSLLVASGHHKHLFLSSDEINASVSSNEITDATTTTTAAAAAAAAATTTTTTTTTVGLG